MCRLVKKTPGVAVLEDIGRAVAQSLRLMLQQLLAQLRAPVQLPQCLKVGESCPRAGGECSLDRSSLISGDLMSSPSQSYASSFFR